jgi:hypothetical protein
VGTILSISIAGPGDGGDSTTGSGMGTTSSTKVLGIMNLSAGIMSSSSGSEETTSSCGGELDEAGARACAVWRAGVDHCEGEADRDDSSS